MGLIATPVIQPAETEVQCNDLDIVTEEVDILDGCPVLPKLQMHVTTRGQCATLEKVLRDRQGNPIDLTNCLCSPAGSASAGDDEPLCGIIVRFMEATGLRTSDPIFEETGFVVDAANGVVRVTLPAEMVECAALYKATWGIFENGNLTYAVEGWLLIEPSLFGFTDPTLRNQGPPTIRELRLTIRDNAPSENTLLDDVEFSDMEIGYAFLRPIREFFEVPPPLSQFWTTKDFPWKEHWIKATQGYLYSMAEAWYRRNRLGTSAGGITIDDRNKEREYLRASQLMLEEWRKFVLNKKVEINAADFTASVNSTYGGIGGL
jgi:hypothetical protein